MLGVKRQNSLQRPLFLIFAYSNITDTLVFNWSYETMKLTSKSSFYATTVSLSLSLSLTHTHTLAHEHTAQ